ncbi:MAG: TIGR03545 family protein [Saccharospirillaceae bacterium]|nr:TIGR03545 family protein [Saccharospirillaceae bacterium]MCD8530445.1 TIGR03545 family protein [Saccharospirillaceae bacterium]
MKQWIRWSGLAAFIAVSLILAVVFLLVAGPLIEKGIETFGSDAAEAKVEVDSVSLSFSPLGFAIHGLTVADSRNPMSNVLQLDKATAQLELAPLFLGKAIIRDLSVDNLQFNTARSTSGALEKAAEQEEAVAEPRAEKDQSSSVLNSVELPSVDDILAREPLRTEQAGNAFQQSYSNHKKAVDDALGKVPDDQALKAYEQELKALTSGSFQSLDDFKARKKKLDELKARFKQDKAAITTAKNALADARNDISDNLKALKAAPGEDLENIRNKYQLSAGGAANMSALLFGEQAGEWSEKALYWYEKVKPYLAKDEAGTATEEDSPKAPRDGRFVHFPSDNPWPGFLLRNAQLTASTASGNMLINAQDITSEPAVLGRPMRIHINGSGLKQVEDLSADIVLDHRKTPGTDTLTLNIKDWQLRDMNLGVAGASLASSLVQVQALAVVSQGKLNAQGDAQFVRTQFSSQGKTTVARELGLALAKVQQFDVNAKASGNITAPEFSLGSDLDKQLNAAFGARLSEKQAQLEAKLQTKLEQKLQSYIGDYAGKLGEFNQLEGSLERRLNKVSELAGQNLEDYQAQKEREAREKAELEQAKAKARLDAEKAAAKADAERKKKEAEEKAKEKLKKLF